MDSQIEKSLLQIRTKIKGVQNLADLDKIYLEVFGKQGRFTALAKEIVKIEKTKRPDFGRSLNEAKKQIQHEFNQKKLLLRTKASIQFIDITAPGQKIAVGHLHLVSQAIEEIVDIFKFLGFSPESYPEIDWDWYAFESLNMPKNHPARDDWETFFVRGVTHPQYGSLVLTPHTSNGQVREMEKVKNPPIRMLNIARCYRRQIDVSHTPMFHQFEGMLIDQNVGIGNLKGTLDFFTSRFFGRKRVSRLRPHHFRFTEPSFEVDITCGICLGRGCRFCKSGWVELGGAGIIHPKVLKMGKIDPEKFSGFAFGWGIERTIAMRTDLGDIRLLYQNDIRFLEQF